jgi:nitroreductase
MKNCLSFLVLIMASFSFAAQDITLPSPSKRGGLTVMEALAKRTSSRNIDSRELSLQQLSDLLWAGFGVNRPDGKRTAPSASDTRENELYVFLKTGTYVYDAPKNMLRLVSAEDLRALTGNPVAPVTVIFVADLARRSTGTRESKVNIACINSGFISENIYLYCASEGLNTGYRGGYDRKALSEKLHLLPTQELIAAQSVGYPRP